MTINADLLEQTMAHIESHPYEHDQNQWRCGTQRCFAGWASYFAGGRFVSSERDIATIVASNGVKGFRSSIVRTPDHGLLHVADHATLALGIDDDVADTLYSAMNSVEDLRAMVDNLINYGSLAGDPTPQHQWEVTSL